MKKRDVFITLAVLMMAGALVAGCAGEGMMDKKMMAMKDKKMMGKKKMMKGDEAAVKARRKLMRGIGADMKRLRTAMKQGSGWVVQEQVRQAAGDMYKKASKIKKAFQKNTLAGKTTSTAAIWKDKGKFNLIADGLAANAAALAQIHYKGGPGAIKKAVGLIGRQCGACHKSFRKKKKR
ncbi:MAG: cytochrome c [Nitrospinae bacterium]|nr:cytochrome c [Nitrospinota bacterium]